MEPLTRLTLEPVIVSMPCPSRTGPVTPIVPIYLALLLPYSTPERYRPLGDPDCPVCGGILKSATISYGQNLVSQDLARAERAAQECDLLLAVGSTLSVYPVAGLVPLAKHSGAKIVIVNGEPTAMDSLADAVLYGGIGDLLPSLTA